MSPQSLFRYCKEGFRIHDQLCVQPDGHVTPDTNREDADDGSGSHFGRHVETFQPWGLSLVQVILMSVAFFIVHKASLARGPGSGKLAFIYLAGFVTLLFAGAWRRSERCHGLAMRSVLRGTGRGQANAAHVSIVGGNEQAIGVRFQTHRTESRELHWETELNRPPV